MKRQSKQKKEKRSAFDGHHEETNQLVAVDALHGACRSPTPPPVLGTADTEIKIPCVESPELTNILPLNPGAGQNTACFDYYRECSPCP